MHTILSPVTQGGRGFSSPVRKPPLIFKACKHYVYKGFFLSGDKKIVYVLLYIPSQSWSISISISKFLKNFMWGFYFISALRSSLVLVPRV